MMRIKILALGAALAAGLGFAGSVVTSLPASANTLYAMESNSGHSPTYVLRDNGHNNADTISTTGSSWSLVNCTTWNGYGVCEHQFTSGLCADWSASTDKFYSESCPAGDLNELFAGITSGEGSGHDWYINAACSNALGVSGFLTATANTNGSAPLCEGPGYGDLGIWYTWVP